MGILESLCTGAVGAAVVVAVKEYLMWRLKRNADKEDKRELQDNAEAQEIKRLSKAVEEMKDSIKKLEEITLDTQKVSKDGLRVVISDRIQTIGVEKLRDGEISIEELKTMTELWTVYHYGLGGNGTYDELMHYIRELPIKSR